MKKRLLIFDLDGTLVDTLPSITLAINMCAHNFCYPQRTEAEVRLAVGNGVDNLLQKTMPSEAMENPIQSKKVKDFFAQCYAMTQSGIDSCYDGIKELISECLNMGFAIAVLSNKPDALVKLIVKNLFEDGMICESVGQTDMPKKPDPYVPLLIAKNQGVEPADVYFIGDSEVDVLTGKNAGMNTVAVSWGFRERTVLEEAEPDVIIDSVKELFEYFKKLT